MQEESVGLAPGGNQKAALRMASFRRTRAGRSSGEGKSHERRRGLKAGEKDPTGGTTRTLLSLLSCSIYRIHSRHRGSMMLKKGEAQKSTTGPTHRRPARRPESQGPPHFKEVVTGGNGPLRRRPLLLGSLVVQRLCGQTSVPSFLVGGLPKEPQS